MSRQPFTAQDLHDEPMGNAEYAVHYQETKPFADISMQLIKHRYEAGLTQAQLARRIGTTQSAISRLESFEYTGIKLETLLRFAEALDLDVEIKLVKRKAR